MSMLTKICFSAKQPPKANMAWPLTRQKGIRIVLVCQYVSDYFSMVVPSKIIAINKDNPSSGTKTSSFIRNGNGAAQKT
jgi:hypothetical protein